MRILVYTGKGGVGKTSIAAATAVKLARDGKRVLVMSTDQAHSLGDSLGMALGTEPQAVPAGASMEKASPAAGQNGAPEDMAPGVPGAAGEIPRTEVDMKGASDGPACGWKGSLEAVEIDPARESRRAWGTLHDYLRQIISDKAEGGIAADEVLLFPGLEELCALIRILQAYEEGRHDVLVVDCAPTGETLALLRYPERLSVLADRLLPMVRGITGVFGGLISRRTSVPKPRDLVFAEFDALVKRLDRLQKILRDREITSLRIVTTPERIVLEEARRNFTWMCEYDFGVDAVCINKIYPQEAMRGYFDGWREAQEEGLRIYAESFPGRRHFSLFLQAEEIRGIPALLRAADELYGEQDPAALFCRDEAFRMEYDGRSGIRTLVIDLPYADPADVRVEKEGEDLILYVRNEVRRLRLPDILGRRALAGWTLEEGELRMRFENTYHSEKR